MRCNDEKLSLVLGWIGSPPVIFQQLKTDLTDVVVERLSNYIERRCKKQVKVVRDLTEASSAPGIIALGKLDACETLGVSPPVESLAADGYYLKVYRRKGQTIAAVLASRDKGIKQGAYHLLRAFNLKGETLKLPALDTIQEPWVPQREWTLVCWRPFFNFTDKRVDVYSYDDERLRTYVDMLDTFGFNGVQLLETCYSYDAVGGVKELHRRHRIIAEEAKRNGQSVTLWVWACYFQNPSKSSGIGVDLAKVHNPQMSMFEDPKVRSVFERFYDLYAENADYVDLLITHWADPGLPNESWWGDYTDLYLYMKLLHDKFRAKNPNVKFARDLWAHNAEVQLKAAKASGILEPDYLILGSVYSIYQEPVEKHKILRQRLKQAGFKFGVWGWYDTEYETDQRPNMHVNGYVLKEIFTKLRELDDILPVSYYSTMDAYHLCNLASLYLSARLLWNPEQDVNEILEEFALNLWGPKNGPIVLEALKLIQDTRSGPSYNTYWWRAPGYRLGTSNPFEDLDRATRCIAAFEAMQPDPEFIPKFPLPYSPEDLADLILPHLRQIQWLARARVQVEKAREAKVRGATREELERILNDTSLVIPIDPFNTWIGLWGQQEAREQAKLIGAARKEILELRGQEE